MPTNRLTTAVLALPRAVKRGIVVAVDASLCVFTVWIAFYLRLNEWVALSDGGWPARSSR
jgi:hypothetical protein